ncbi:hypothetical protein NP233_g5916 [Leucocoprinus birnbaumii]|uniref:F-box domain-containing protein n=1 Tax=Leucocoprinus birnbaumii TaxID=56174 RepID=A0AAD5VRY4_9AGAR|nr:hypothetical protein NP233_g5916 [Leucocoprinus birnbaumii]
MSETLVDADSLGLASLRERIRTTEDEFSTITRLRYRLFRQLNEKQDQTHVFPAEILSSIFEYAYLTSSDDPYTFPDPCVANPLQLGCVSSRWRRIAWCTPRLWRNLRLKIHNEVEPSTLHVFRLHLENIGRFTLNIAFVFEPCFLADFRSAPLRRTLCNRANSSKIEALHLAGKPAANWVSRITASAFPQLKCFTFCPYADVKSDHVSGCLLFNNFPALSKLQLKECQHEVDIVNSLNITEIDLTYTTITTCAEILLSCPNVVKYRSLNPYGAGWRDPQSTVSSEPISFPRLRDLHCEAYKDDLWASIWDRLQLLPSLHETNWIMDNLPRQEGLRQISSVLRASTANLKRLTLKGVYKWTRWDIKELLEHAKQLEVLDMECDDLTAFDVIFVLGLPHKDGGVLLPALRDILVQVDPGDEYWEDLQYACIKMLQIRGSMGNLPSVIGLGRVWSLEAREKLDELVHAGGWDIKVQEPDPIVKTCSSSDSDSEDEDLVSRSLTLAFWEPAFLWPIGDGPVSMSKSKLKGVLSTRAISSSSVIIYKRF